MAGTWKSLYIRIGVGWCLFLGGDIVPMRWDRTSCFLRNTAETYVHPLLVYPPGNLKVCSKWGFPGAGVDMLHPTNDRTSTTTTTSATSTTTTSATSDKFESNLNNKTTVFSFVEPSPTSFNVGTWLCNHKKLKKGDILCLCVLFAP